MSMLGGGAEKGGRGNWERCRTQESRLPRLGLEWEVSAELLTLAISQKLCVGADRETGGNY